MDTFSLSYSLINNINHNNEFLRLFKQTAFLIYRNTYGGLTYHEIEALDTIKKNMSQHIQDQDKAYLTRLIDALSLYDLPYILTKAAANAILEKEMFNFIASQRQSDLCDILSEHINRKNALCISIKNDQDSLAQVQALLEFTKSNLPSKITDPMPSRGNIWDIIKNANDLPDGYIHIAFTVDEDDSASLLCYKGLCMAEAYLKEIQIEDAVVVRREKITKAFAPSVTQGIVTLTNAILGKSLNSRFTLDKDLNLEDQLQALDATLNDPQEIAQLPKKQIKALKRERAQKQRMLAYQVKQEAKLLQQQAKEEAQAAATDSESLAEDAKDNEGAKKINTNTALLAAMAGSDLPNEDDEDNEPIPLFSSFKGHGHFDIEQGFLFIVT